jgi:hypothetical protein
MQCWQHPQRYYIANSFHKILLKVNISSELGLPRRPAIDIAIPEPTQKLQVMSDAEIAEKKEASVRLGLNPTLLSPGAICLQLDAVYSQVTAG